MLANLDDDMTNEPSLGVYGAREAAEVTAKELGHTLTPLWTNRLGELHRDCMDCRHKIIIRERCGVVGLAGRASYLRCGEEPTFTHVVRFSARDSAGVRVMKTQRVESEHDARAFVRFRRLEKYTIEEVKP